MKPNFQTIIYYCLTICSLLTNNPWFCTSAGAQAYKNGDTTGIRRLYERGIALDEAYPDSSRILFERALQRSLEMNYTDGILRGNYNLACWYHDRGDFIESNHYAERAIRIYKTHPSPGNARDIRRVTHTLMGKNYLYAGQYAQARAFTDSVRPLYPDTDPANQRMQSMIHNIQANAWFQEGIYDSALHHYHQIQKLFPQFDTTNYIHLFDAYKGIGSIHLHLNNYSEAQQYFRIAADIGTQFRNPGLQATAWYHMSNVFASEYQYDSGKIYAHRALEVIRGIPSHLDTRSLSASAMALNLLSQDSAAAALPFCLEAFAYAPNSTIRIWTETRLGSCYLMLKDYNGSEEHLLSALDHANENHLKSNVTDIYKYLSDLYEARGDFKKALGYKDQYIRLKDSLVNKENSSRIATMELRYRTAEKDNEILVQKLINNRKDNEIRQQRLWMAGIIGGLALLFFLSTIIYRNSIQKQKLQLKDMEGLRRLQEIETLKARMDGEEQERSRLAREIHDGAASQLFAIKLFVDGRRQAAAEAPRKTELNYISEQLEEVRTELRRTAHNLTPELLLQQGMAFAISALCERTIRNTPLQVSLQIIEDIPRFNGETEISIYRITQEIIQNTLKHSGATELYLELSYHEGMLSFVAEDNGRGVSEGVLKDHSKGMGLYNLQERVQALGGHMDLRNRKSGGISIHLEFEMTPVS